jgi:putative FmdB family regulatory protein
MIVYDYRCEECAEIFEQDFKSRDDYRKTVAVTCPTCGSGLTRRIVSAPAVSIWWKNAAAAPDAWSMRPRFHPATRSKALSGR